VIPSPCVSILGGIQPGPLRSYLKAIQSGQEADDRLISRFQLIVYPDQSAQWHNVDRWPDCEAKDRAFAIFRALDGLDATSVGAQFEGNDPLPYLRFSDEAQEFFDEWRSSLENEKLRVEGESPLIESHLSKYRSLMPSLSWWQAGRVAYSETSRLKKSGTLPSWVDRDQISSQSQPKIDINNQLYKANMLDLFYVRRYHDVEVSDTLAR
jgi:hypothetical protein